MSRCIVPHFLDGPSAAVDHVRRPADRIITATPTQTGEQIDRVAPIHHAIADAIAAEIDAGRRPAAVLGDCCQTIGVMAGLARRGLEPTILWLDSHGDFNTWETTPSGFLGGMPLAMLTGRGDQRMLNAVGLAPIADKRVVLAGARDLDPGERDLVRSSRIVEVLDLDRLIATLPDGSLYLHFDTDVIDSRLAPAFLYPAAGGPSPEAARAVVAAIMATKRVVAVTATVGWSVERDTDHRTRDAVELAMAPLFF